MSEKITIADLFDHMLNLPEIVMVDIGHGFYELEHISRATMRGGVMTAGSGEMTIQFVDHEAIILPSETMITIIKTGQGDD